MNFCFFILFFSYYKQHSETSNLNLSAKSKSFTVYEPPTKQFKTTLNDFSLNRTSFNSKCPLFISNNNNTINRSDHFQLQTEQKLNQKFFIFLALNRVLSISHLSENFLQKKNNNKTSGKMQQRFASF